MLPNEIEKLIMTELPTAKVKVSTEDNHHFTAVVIDDTFVGMSLVNRQRKVYAALNEQIKNGEIHAISFKALTQEEFKKV